MSYQELNYFNKKLNVQEAMCLLETKINELIEVNNAEHADHLDMMERFKEIDEFIAYLQGVGLEKEVRKVMDVFVLDGTFEKLINEKVLNDINDRVNAFIKQTDVKLEGKRDKAVLLTQTDLSTSSEAHKLTMNHLSQDVKNAMTGTAPVSPNIADGQITTQKVADKAITTTKLADKTANVAMRPAYHIQSPSFEEWTLDTTNSQLTIKNFKDVYLFTGADSSVSKKVASVSTLVIPSLGCAYIDLNEAYNSSTGYTVQVAANMHSVGQNYLGAFVEDKRVILLSNEYGSFGGPLAGKLSKIRMTDRDNIHFTKLTAGDISWDSTTRTLKWDCDLLMFKRNSVEPTTNRMKLSKGSITCPNQGFMTIYIDLDLMTSNEINDSSVCVKAAPYHLGGYNPNKNHLLLATWSYFADELVIENFLPLTVKESDPLSELAPELLVRKHSETQITVFTKQSNGYVGYGLTRWTMPFDGVSPQANADTWRISSCDKFLYTGTNFTKSVEICNPGEWETAILETGAADFFGGRAHGDQVLTGFDLLIDGKSITNITGDVIAKKVSLKQKSILYRCNTQTPVADNVKIIEITQDGLVLDQHIEWLVSLNLTKAYLAMFPIKRKFPDTTGIQITNKVYTDFDFETYDVSEDGFTNGALTQRVGVKDVVIFGETSGIIAKTEVLERSPELPKNTVFIQNSPQYNKVYYDFCGEYTTHVNEKWRQKTRYTINV